MYFIIWLTNSPSHFFFSFVMLQILLAIVSVLYIHMNFAMILSSSPWTAH